MKRGIGYAFAVVGLLVLVVAMGYLDSFHETFEIFSGNQYTLIFAGLLIVVGVVLSVIAQRSEPKSKQEKEVPIYEGHDVVGYRRGSLPNKKK